MAYTLETIHQYGYAPIGNLKDMIVEAIMQLGALGKTRKEIADVLQVSRSMVDTYVQKYNIPVSDRRTAPKKKLSGKTPTDFLTLWNQGFEKEEIAIEWDCSIQTLRKWMEDHGLNKKYVYNYKLNNKTVEEFLELEKTMGVTEIAKYWGINKVSLYEWRKANNLKIYKRRGRHA